MSLNPFLEERISINVRYGWSYDDEYNVRIVETSSDAEYRTLVHPFPKRHFQIAYMENNANIYAQIVNLYHRVYAKFAGFRAKCLDDYTTNGLISAPTALDQTLTLVSSGVYQLQKTYGLDKPGLSIGRPSRVIYKPVAGTTLVSVGAVVMPSTLWTVDTTTGKVTFQDKTFNVSGITKASQAVVTLGSHTLQVDESVYFAGVIGMTQINTLRGTILAKDATHITVNIDSSAFSTYSSGGVVHSNPQGAEIVTGGCEFDIPVRFNTTLNIQQNNPVFRDTGSIELVELLEP